MKRSFYRIPAAAGAVAFFYYVGCLLVSGWNTSGLWVWPLFGALCFVLAAGLRRSASETLKPWRKVILRGMLILLAALSACFFLFEAGVIWGMKQKMPEQTLDYVIVLGGGVVGEEPSPALEQRILTACAYLKSHETTRVIATGGKGGGRISEAACIARSMQKLGIEEDRILMENRATTTAENFQFSRPFVQPDAKVGIVTSNFHIFRSLLLARSAGFTHVCAIPAPFGGWMLPHYMVREFMTATVELFRGNICRL